MPNKRTFKVGADTYDIDEQDVNSFLKDMPDAVEQKSFTVDKDTFDIPIPEVSAFLSDNPNAQPTFGEKKKDVQESVSEEKPKPAQNTDYSSSSTKKQPGRLTDFLPEQYRTPEVLAEADNIVKTNSPEKALKKLNDLKTQIDVSNGAPDTRKKKPDQAIADYDITKDRPELDFNAAVTSNYNDALNQMMGDPGPNGVWLNPKPDVQGKAKEFAFKKALESEAGQRIKAVSEHAAEITEDVKRNLNSFSEFLNKTPIPAKVTEYLKSKKTALANDISSPTTNPFFLQQYSIAKKQQIDLEKERNLPELEYEQKTRRNGEANETVYEPTPESVAKREAAMKLYDDMKVAYDNKYSSLAKMKAATSKIIEGISTNKMPSSQEIGRASLRALGNEELAAAEKMEMEGVPLTPKMKYNLDRIGEDALKNTIAIYKPFANRGDEVAKDVVAVASHMIADKDGLLKRNPEFAKEQKIDLLSNELASNPNDYYGTPFNPLIGQVLKNTGAYVITDAMIEKAAKKLGIDPTGILSSDLKTANVFGAATAGVIGDPITNLAGLYERVKNRKMGYSGEAADELANRWKDKDAFFRQLYNVPKVDELQQGSTIINTDKNSDTYLSDIPNPDAGKYNWGLASVLNTISYGLGQTYGLGKGGIITGNLMKGAGMLGKAEAAAKLADNVGMFTYGYVTGYDRNYETGLQKFQGQDNAGTKAAVYASLYSFVENLVEQSILPETRIVREMEGGAGREAAADLVGRIVSNGASELDKRTLKEGVMNIARGIVKTGKGVGEETAEEIVTNIGGNVIDSLTSANKDPNYNFVKEQFDTAIQTALQSFLSIGLAEVRTKSPLKENILHYAANNPTQMITAIKQYQREGKIDAVTAGKRIVAVNTLAQLNSQVPTTDPITNKKLSTEEQVQYLADSYRIALAEKEIKDAASSGTEVGKVKKERLEKIIKQSQERQKAILESPIPVNTMEMGILDEEKPGEAAKSETVIPARNGDLVALKFSDEEKATYNALTDPDQKQAMIDAKREELSKAGFKDNPENISKPIDLSIDAPAEVTTPEPVTKKKGSDIDLTAELGKKETTAQKLFTIDKEGNVIEVEKLAEANGITTVKLDNGATTVRTQTELFKSKEDADKYSDQTKSELTPTTETAPKVDEITVGEMVDKVGTYKGEKGRFYQDGQSVIFKVDGQNKEYELGNINDVKDTPISSFSIGHEESVVNLNNAGNVVVRGEEYKNNYSDPTQAINRDKDGNVVSVNLETPDGKKRTFRGNIAEDIAYQIHLKEITKDNGTKSEFEQFINEGEASKEMDNAGLSETSKTTTIEDNATVSREKIEPKTVAEFVDRISKGERMTTPEELKFYENNKTEIEKALADKAKSESKPTNSSDLEFKKADIEKRRQAELKALEDSPNSMGANGNYQLADLTVDGGWITTKGINEKYDAELKALEKQPANSSEPIAEQLKSEPKNNFSFEPKTNEVLGTPEVVVKDNNGNTIGNITTSLDPKDKNSLIVQSIDVKPNNQNEGIGKQLYLELAKNNPDKTIKSSPRLADEYAIKAWESLVRDGIAEKIGENKYEIKPQSKQSENKSSDYSNEDLMKAFPELDERRINQVKAIVANGHPKSELTSMLDRLVNSDQLERSEADDVIRLYDTLTQPAPQEPEPDMSDSDTSEPPPPNEPPVSTPVSDTPNMSANESKQTLKDLGYDDTVLEQPEFVEMLELKPIMDHTEDIVNDAKNKYGNNVYDYARGLYNEYMGLSDSSDDKVVMMIKLQNDLEVERRSLHEEIVIGDRDGIDTSGLTAMEMQVNRLLKTVANWVDTSGNLASRRLNLFKLQRMFMGENVMESAGENIVGSKKMREKKDVDNGMKAPITETAETTDTTTEAEKKFEEPKENKNKRKPSADSVKSARNKVGDVANARSAIFEKSKNLVEKLTKKKCH